MPLVVPGLMSKDGNSSGGDDWLSKLAGKKIGEQHNETVSRYVLHSRSTLPMAPTPIHLCVYMYIHLTNKFCV